MFSLTIPPRDQGPLFATLVIVLALVLLSAFIDRIEPLAQPLNVAGAP